MSITDERLAELAAEAVEDAIQDLIHDRMGSGEHLEDELEGLTEEECDAVIDRYEAAIGRYLPVTMAPDGGQDPENAKDHKDHPGIFLWDYADLLRSSGWRLTRQIQVPLSTQQVHPDIVGKFRESRRLARLERYLLVAEAQDN